MNMNHRLKQVEEKVEKIAHTVESNSAAIKEVSVVDPDPEPDPDPYWIRIQWGLWIWIRIRIRNPDPDPDPGGQK